MTYIKGKTFSEERALYAISDTMVEYCSFAGEDDGESALKETKNIGISNCEFFLRYPLWHSNGFSMKYSKMKDTCRAPIWYSENLSIDSCDIFGIKCLRESKNIKINNSHCDSEEFGWRCSNIDIKNSDITSKYFLFESKNIEINNLKMQGKYSFQYIENAKIENSVLNTKDAFWHSKNVTVKDSIVNGEYLGWYSENLTLINCEITGTQPLCYAFGLKLINCTMKNCDLSFEYSDVDADIKGEIISVKNPKSGIIKAEKIGKIILEDSVIESKCIIEERK